MENNLKNKVMGNMVWRLAERYGAQIVQFIVSIVLARILMPEIYGTIALITIFITILQVFIDSGFGNALIQKKDADDLDFSTVFYFNIVLCGILYIAIFFLAPVIANFYNNRNLIPVIRVLSLSLVFSSLKNVQQAYVSRNMQFKKFFFATLFGTIVSAFVGILMAYRGFGVWAIVAQNLTNLALDTLILWITVKWRPKLMFSFERLKQLFSFGWKLLISALLEVTYTNVRQLVIGKKYSSEELAYYNKGNQFPNLIVTNINSSIDSVLLPTMSREQDDKDRVKQMTRKAIQTSSYIIAPMMIGLAVVAGSVIRLVLTDKWLFAVPFMQIFCLDYMFYPIHTSNLNAMKAIGRSDLFLKLEVIKKTIGCLILLSTVWFGPIAIALGLLVSSLISIFINAFPNRKLLGYSYFEQIKDIFPNILTAAFMGVIVWCVGFIPINYIALLFIQIVVGIIVYILISALLKNKTFEYLFEAVKQVINKKRKTKQKEEVIKKEMKLGIMQPYFVPYIGYFQLMNAVDKYVIYDDVNFIKGGWINRNRILLNGQPAYFNIPMIGASSNKLINEVEVNTNKTLMEKNLKTIYSAYGKAPYYNEVYPLIEKILLNEEKDIAKFIKYSFEIICEYLDIKTEFVMSSELKKNNELKAQDKVLHICEILGATEYYNAIGGQELYDYESFSKKGIKLKFVKTDSIEYKQFDNEFQPNLSIIDVLMFNSKDEVKEMLNKFSLIEK